MAGTGHSGESAQAKRAKALERANAVRQRRAEVKKGIRAGSVNVSDLLNDPPEFLQAATLSEILRAAPGYGEVRVRRLMQRCQLSPLKTIGALTKRQREELVGTLHTPDGGPPRSR
jgi:hypothetical protein